MIDMNKKEHFEVILEDINSKLSLLLEKLENLGHKIDKYNIDFNKQIDEMNEFLKKRLSVKMMIWIKRLKIKGNIKKIVETNIREGRKWN